MTTRLQKIRKEYWNCLKQLESEATALYCMSPNSKQYKLSLFTVKNLGRILSNLQNEWRKLSDEPIINP